MAVIPTLVAAPLDRPVLVGYSGGLDSTVLLHLLVSDARVRRRGLRAIHVHHGLHAGADAWAQHCIQACVGLGVDLDLRHVEVERGSGAGLEAAARAARHGAYAAALHEDEVLALAHHRDDQAETFLLRALRASGVDGLAAMRPWRPFGRGWMWRPLLETGRHQLQAYASGHGLQWIEDPSNDSDAHDRNFLRRHVMPLLRTRWPQAGDAFAQAARLQGEAAALLEQEDARALALARTADPACLQVAALAALPAARRARVLRRWVEVAGLPPLPARAIAPIEGLITAAAATRGEFRWHGARIRRWRGLLWAGRIRPAARARMAWDGTAPLPWGGGELSLEPALAAGETFEDGDAGAAPPFVVHPRMGGERIALPGRGHSHALKHVLQDLGVPPWVREGLPLVSDRGGQLLAAGDLALSARLDAWLRRSGRRLRWNGG